MFSPLLWLLVIVCGISVHGGSIPIVNKDNTTISNLKAEYEAIKHDPKGNFMALLHLAFQVKTYSSNEVQEIEHLLPVAIQNMTSSNVCLYFAQPYTVHYFYAFANSHFDPPISDQRLGTQWQRPSNGASWAVELAEDGDAVYLRNVDLNQYLCAEEKQYPEQIYEGRGDARMLHLAEKAQSDLCLWKFDPENGSSQSKMLVKNVKSLENLEWNCGGSKYPIFTVCLSSEIYHWSVEKC
jgi:hypothetical protein